MIIWSFGGELSRVPNGKRVTLKCTKCNKESTFHECIVDDKFTVFFVLDLWKQTKRVMQCGECLGVCDYYQLYPHEKQEEQEAAEKAQKEMMERQAAEDAKRRAQEEAEQKKQDAIELKRRAEEQKRKDKEVDDELEKIKKKLGK